MEVGSIKLFILDSIIWSHFKWLFHSEECEHCVWIEPLHG